MAQSIVNKFIDVNATLDSINKHLDRMIDNSEITIPLMVDNIIRDLDLNLSIKESSKLIRELVVSVSAARPDIVIRKAHGICKLRIK